MANNKYTYKISENGRQMVDITNRTFGRLTALYPTERRDCKGSIYWHCKCTCGNEKDVPVDALITGDYVSCGCRKKEINENVSSYLHLSMEHVLNGSDPGSTGVTIPVAFAA